MSFNKAPINFFGPGYALTSSAIVIPTVDAADITIGTFTCDGTTATVTASADHNLKVGDKVSLSTTTTLPAPFTAADHFVVSAPTATTLTLSLTKGGAAIVSTDTGTGTHTIKALAPLQLVTDAEAHATTGDWREIFIGLLDLAYHKQQNTPTADRSGSVVFSKLVRALPSDPSVLLTTFGVTVKTENLPGAVIPE